MTAYDWDELRGLSLARQFPELTGRDAVAVADTVRRIGPIQSQTARSPYAGLGARLPGVSHDVVTEAYESWAIVRGSTIRGTVHTVTADQHSLLDATTRATQRPIWVRYLKLEHTEVEDVWRATENFAADTWRTPADLQEHLQTWLHEHEGSSPDELIDRGLGRYLGFGHGGLIRRPLKGSWSGQSAPVYRTASAVLPDRAVPGDPLLETVRLHVASYGPSSRHDVAWWSGLGLRQVDELLERLDLTWRDGPDGRRYADLPDAAPARELPGVRLLPEFDAVLCGYDSRARDRFVSPTDNELLWHRNNGYMLAPLLVDGRIGGYWRLEGRERAKELAISSFAGSRRPRKSELEEPAAALSTALGVPLSRIDVSRL
ncbi:MAG: AlkZ family DNA glycosylase [Nocardioides sp.]|nr:AlkZ family DNA glycosylase [Nocardioides sp.]